MAFTKITLATQTIKQGFTAVNNLITDLLSVASGKGASQIGIQDSADNLAATNVETAIAEIYTDLGSAYTMADILDENPDTCSGLNWGYKAGLIRVDNVITTVTASTVLLTDDDINYVEIRKNGSVVANTTGFTSGRIPVRQVTCASGAQTVSTDKRAWFQAISDDMVVGTTITIPNTGLHILDSNASHDLIIKPGSDLSADRTLTVTTGDADRTLALGGLAVTLTAEDAAGTITLDNCGFEVEDTTNAGNKIKIINGTSDDDKVLTLNENFTVGNGYAGTVTFLGASKTLSLNESLTIGNGEDVTITAEDIAGSIVLDNCSLEVEDTTNTGNKIKLINAGADTDKTISLAVDLTIASALTLTGALTVESDSVVNQDLSSDAQPTFANVKLTNATDHCILVGSGAAALTPIAAMTNGQIVIGATSADPAPQSMIGDATLAANGTLTIGASKITQSKLKSTYGAVNTAAGAWANLTLPGGDYGFYPKIAPGQTGYYCYASISYQGYTTGTYATIISLYGNGGAGVPAYARQYYIQSSPPYDLGNGEIPLFIFVKIASGKIKSMYVAPDPPWANNGPTDIAHNYEDPITGKKYQRMVKPSITKEDIISGKADLKDLISAKKEAIIEMVEVTQDLKQADMPLIPHPFCDDLEGENVLLDPCSDITQALYDLHMAGENVAEIISLGYVDVSPDECGANSSPNVKAVKCKFKNTK